jgi:hypothetical protein
MNDLKRRDIRSKLGFGAAQEMMTQLDLCFGFPFLLIRRWRKSPLCWWYLALNHEQTHELPMYVTPEHAHLNAWSQ